MPPNSLPRLAFRQSRWMFQRRAQSSTTEAAAQKANQAKESVSQATSKGQESVSQATSQASQGLSRVQSSAGNVLRRASNATANAVSGVSGRTGRLINVVQGLIPPTIYYARVGGELAKIIYRGRSMHPPNIQTVQGYLQPLRNAFSNPSSFMSRTSGAAESAAEGAANNPQSLVNRVRSMDSATMVSAGIVAAETLGFFCVGEMIGRFKIVGYRGGHSEHH